MFGLLSVHHLAAGTPHAAPVTGIIRTVVRMLQAFGVPAGLLVAVFGGLMQTKLFSGKRAPRKGPE